MQAVKLYSEALELDGGMASAYNNRALAHLKLDNLADAEADCGYVLRLEPQNVKAFLRRGSARYCLSYLVSFLAPLLPSLLLLFHSTTSSHVLLVLPFLPMKWLVS